ncbi:AraC family transcriptional regulator [Saccharospirillum sp. HFRX-1]|uniref:AraC family transcriptional regulator n=1 Tax=unclassified Saccharospirillum TaxID=2633430 RepID=UPI00371C4B7A
MQNELLNRALRFAASCADPDGVAPTELPGITLIRQTRPTPLQYDIYKPLVALVLQGEKQVTVGRDSFQLRTGESLVVAANVPNVSQITKASLAKPYVSLVIDLDLAILENLVQQIDAVSEVYQSPVGVDVTEAEVTEAALRLMRLLDRPQTRPILQDALIRELHYWLLVGPHGAAIRELGAVESHTQRITQAIALLRERFTETLRVETLAQRAGMSVSSFYEHFRAVTSLSPLQFQKQLRLIEARRRMLAEGAAISTAAYGVGYESVPQFTREYARTFGLPPAREIKAARAYGSGGLDEVGIKAVHS